MPPFCLTISFLFSALGYLYSAAALKLLRPENSRGVLAAACLLGRMDDLCSYAYEACKQSITVETINGWLDFVETIPSSTDGTTTPENLPAPTLFGYYAQRLRDDVLHFLVVTLPSVLDIHNTSPQSNGRNNLLQIFSRVPFNLFKTAVESPTFQIGSQTNFIFAPPCFLSVSRDLILMDDWWFAVRRIRPGSIQVRKRSHRIAETRHRKRGRCRGDSRTCIRRGSTRCQCRTYHSKGAEATSVEGQLLIRIAVLCSSSHQWHLGRRRLFVFHLPPRSSGRRKRHGAMIRS